MGENEELRQKACAEVGLPAEFASRLVGETPEDFAQDAKQLAATLRGLSEEAVADAQEQAAIQARLRQQMRHKRYFM